MTALLAADQMLPEADLDPLELAGLVEDLANDPRSWRHLIRRVPNRYWSTCLLRDQGVSAWLVGWPAKMGTGLHTHGPAATALAVVRGGLTHVLASRSGEILGEPLASGTLLTVEPRALHGIRNQSLEPAVSIHAYSPPVDRVTDCRRSKAHGCEPIRRVR